jgi:hypothetical protein
VTRILACEAESGHAPIAPPDEMVHFRVADLSMDGSLAMLLDAERLVHVVRLAGGRLVRGSVLSGRRAKLGAHVFVEVGGLRPLHARFESVACSQDVALALLHPTAA